MHRLLMLVAVLLAGAEVRASAPAAPSAPSTAPAGVALVHSVKVSIGSVPLEVRVGRRGEHVLGPSDFRRRASARANPYSPAGRYVDKPSAMLIAAAGTQSLMLEGSVFNTDRSARVPQSAAARLSLRPLDAMVVQLSYGSVLSTERHDRGARVSRMTASTTYTTQVSDATWATTALWGVSAPLTDEPLTNAVLLESGVDLDAHHTVFGRVEYLQRSAIELGASRETPTYDVASGSLGYVYAFAPLYALVPSVGVAASLDVVDQRIAPGRSGVQPGAMLFMRGVVN